MVIGSFNLLKGVQYVVQAAEDLSDKDIHFTFIGKPSYEEDKNDSKIESMNNCTYIESVPHVSVNALLFEKMTCSFFNLYAKALGWLQH